MKETNTTTIGYERTAEQSLAMYMETVSPPREMLINILNQIPEKEKVTEHSKRRAIRSPYMWLAITQLVSVFVIMFAVIPTAVNPDSYDNNPFYAVDKQVDDFEKAIANDDYQRMMTDYTL